MKIKVCGLTREDDVRACVKLGAWAVGFVFAESSPRRLTVEKAALLRQSVPRSTLAVGVFEDAAAPEILATAAQCKLDAVQIHGAWPTLFEETAGLTIFRALGLRRSRAVPPVSPRVAGLLIEPRRGKEARKAGRAPSHMEQRWAWAQAAVLKAEGRMIILAGGLSVENVSEAVRSAGRPDAVDVSSGVEKAPGVKDEAKLRAFFAAARNA